MAIAVLNLRTNGGVLDFFFPIKKKIRIESCCVLEVEKGGRPKVHREFHTFRALVKHYTHILPFLIKQVWRQYVLWLRVASTPMALQRGSIAFVSNAVGSNYENTNPFAFNFTTSGSNTTNVLELIWWSNLRTITRNTPTYNSVGMTLGASVHADTTYEADIWYLGNPTTGTNSVSVSFSANSYGRMGMTCLSGTNSAAPLDNTASTALQSGASPGSTSITTNYDNSMLVDTMLTDTGILSTLASSGGTTDWVAASRGGASSHKGTTTKGAYAMAWTWTGTAVYWGQTVVAIREAAASGPVAVKPTRGFMTLMGIGN